MRIGSIFIGLALIAFSGCKFEQTQAPDSIDPRKQDRESAVSVPGPDALDIFFWNVESEGADPQVIARQLKDFDDYDLFAFCEVAPADFQLFREACGQDFMSVDSRSGDMDRLQIVYNTKRFELVRQLELDEINPEGRYRSPLVAHLRDRQTGTEFLFMTNHLARGKAERRQEQATLLVEWARNQNLPIIAIGDFNFDFVFESETGNEAFKIFLRDGIWKWIRPEELIDSNWFDPEPDGKDNYPGSILDFAFVAGSAKTWPARCRVIVRDGDFPDDETTSDHRPIELRIELPKNQGSSE